LHIVAGEVVALHCTVCEVSLWSGSTTPTTINTTPGTTDTPSIPRTTSNLKKHVRCLQHKQSGATTTAAHSYIGDITTLLIMLWLVNNFS